MTVSNPTEVREIRQIAHAFIISRLVYLAAKLGVADHLKDGAASAGDLAALLDVQPRPLYRVLRALAGAGIFREEPGERFSLAPLGQPLRTDSPDSLRAYVILNHELTYPTLTEIMHSLKTGEPTFPKVFGKPIFEYFELNPGQFASFQAAMRSSQRAWDSALVEAYDFSNARRVVDVGGGTGSLLSTILARHGGVSGVLFERESVIEAARKSQRDSLPRCEFVAGDFFKSVPSGGDIYLLRRILHDWQDDQAATILRNCRSAMNVTGRILIMEIVLGPANQPTWGHVQDLIMLACADGMERTQRQYADLLSIAGLRLDRVVQTPSDLSILVAVDANG
jgi:hypothetical protein